MQLRLSGIALALFVSTVAPAAAQERGKDFLFGRPDWSLAVRGGYAYANANSDVFEFATNNLTLNRRDFSGMAFGADLSYSIRSNLDLVLGISYAGASKKSEFRRWEDNNKLPIEQTTKFSRLPVTASLKWYLASRGRSVGRFAWIPAKYTPYVGAGVGMVQYTFEQVGDLVDFQNNNVFKHDYTSSDWAKTAHVLAGLDYSLGPRWALTTEARYSWAKADLGDAFSGFGPIDLSGFTTTVGLFIRF